MAFFINNGWDVSHHHTHEAFIHLGKACNINLNAIKYIESIPDDTPIPYFLKSSNIILGEYNNESKQCIKATILFQAGMEAWISWAYTQEQLNIKKPRNFKDKWTKAFSHLNIDFDFSPYSDFYDNLRNPIIHPTTEQDIEKIAKIKSENVYRGFQAGWSATETLSAALGLPFDENSWEIMCEINGVVLPDKIKDLGELQTLYRELRKKSIKSKN